MELWTVTRSLPNLAAKAAVRAEDEGWTGLTFSDSQNRSGDPYVMMSLASSLTNRLRLSTGVTNPFTRHAAVTASAICCVQSISEGRAELGIGRGDSSLALLGLAPASLGAFTSYLEDLAAYLRGARVLVRPADREGFRSLESSIPLANSPKDNRIEWLDRVKAPTVPLWVAATGPKVISAAAAIADRVVLALGADPARLKWGIDQARAVRPDVAIGAYVNVLVGDDVSALRAAAAGAAAGLARFGAMHGNAVGPVRDTDREMLESIPRQYDMVHHFEAANDAARLSDDFLDRYAILGSAGKVTERIQELGELGIGRLHVLGPSQDVDREMARRFHRSFVTEVIPRVAA